jgi:DNA polymerase III sliding clamp (beta) subunit (PCNA family)
VPPAAVVVAAQALVLDRRALTFALRFASRLASRAPIQALKSCLFAKDSLVATDLDVSLRVRIPGARGLEVLLPAEALKRCVSGSGEPEVEIRRTEPTESRPFAVSVNGAILAGHDPSEFPDPSRLFPDGEPQARALLHTLEPVLVAAATDNSRKSMNAVFFQLCKNAAIATDGHRLHALGIESRDSGDFLVPRKAVELVENIRRATRSTEVRVDFFEHQAVLHVGPFDVSVRLEIEKFLAWEEVIPKQSRHELRFQKKSLLEALDRIAAAMNSRSRGVLLRSVAEGLEIYGRNPDAGELGVTIPASGWKAGERLGLNLSYLHDAVRHALSDEVTLSLSDDTHPIKVADGTYLAIVMPIRLEKGEIP